MNGPTVFGRQQRHGHQRQRPGAGRLHHHLRLGHRTITINGPVNGPTVSAGNNGGTIKVNVPVQGGSILTGGTLGNLTIGGPLSGQVVTIGNMNGTVTINGPVQGGVIATSGSINGNLTIGGPLSGQLLSVGNINGNVTINGGLQSGRIASLGSILGNLTINGWIDSQSALVSGGEIGDMRSARRVSVGNNQGIIAAKGNVNFNSRSFAFRGNTFANVGSSSSTDPNAPLDAAAIDAIFTQGGQPLSFDLNPGDLAGLSGDREGPECPVHRRQQQGQVPEGPDGMSHNTDHPRCGSRFVFRLSRLSVRPIIDVSWATSKERTQKRLWRC